MSVQDLGVVNDYPVKCGEFQLLNPPAPASGWVLTTDGSGNGTWASLPGPPALLNNDMSAQFSTGATARNFGNSTIHVPFDVISYNPTGNWVLQNGNTTNADFLYNGPSGVFMVTYSIVYQFFGGSAEYGNSFVSVNVSQQGSGVAFQPVTTNAIGIISNTVVANVNTGNTLQVALFGNGVAAGDFVAQPGLGGGNIVITQIA